MELAVSAYTVPTDAPESDGTSEWDATTLVVVEADGGLGWTYAPAAAGALVSELLAPAIGDPDDLGTCWSAMLAAVRNAGPWGLAMYALSAVDIALWDRRARRLGVGWLEEPVSSDDPGGLRRLRGRVPGMAVAAGEYATSAFALRALLGSVDVLQADVTRCGGITGFRQADALCFAHGTPLSAHCAPSLAVHPMAASQQGLHIEWFHDHVRIESRLFDGALEPDRGALRPDPARLGHGLALNRDEAERFRVA